MATKEIFLTPDPTGDGDVERVGVTESSGSADAGRLVALNDQGIVGDSMMAYSGAPDMTPDEYAGGRVLGQALTGAGLVWRWLGISSLADWLTGRVMDFISPVGTIRSAFSTVDSDYWVYLDGRQIGNAASGAHLAGDRYEALFLHLWGAISGQYALTLYNSSGQEVTRGASAKTDWDAARRLALPDMRNRMQVGVGSSFAMGQTGGARTVALTADELPGHSFTVNTAQTGAAESVEFVTGATAGTTVTSTPRNIDAVSNAQTSIDPAGIGPHVHPVSVTVAGSRAEQHEHPVTVDPTLPAAHTHLAETLVTVQETPVDPLVTLTADATTTVDPAQDGEAHIHTAKAGFQPSPAATHVHTASGSCQAQTSDTKHSHTAVTQVTTQVSFNVQSTAQTTLNLTKARKTITTVGEGSASTNTVGANSPHENMPPFWGVAMLIRY